MNPDDPDNPFFAGYYEGGDGTTTLSVHVEGDAYPCADEPDMGNVVGFTRTGACHAGGCGTWFGANADPAALWPGPDILAICANIDE